MNANEKLKRITALLNSIPFAQRAASRPIREALEILADPTDETPEEECVFCLGIVERPDPVDPATGTGAYLANPPYGEKDGDK